MSLSILHKLVDLQQDVPLAPLTTLRVGGKADLFYRATRSDAMARVIAVAQAEGYPYLLLGGGSNVCISDRGVRGLVIHNACRRFEIGERTFAETGAIFMDLFRGALTAGLGGLEFAVGIPGTLGGALVSNAGAYRQNIDVLVRELEVVENGQRRVVGPEWMGFSYRDSRLRRGTDAPATVISAILQLAPGSRKAILERARENQRQRIFKQPWFPSAGSFFKNVVDRPDILESLPELPDAMRRAGVIPAGYLSAACGCKGLAVGGAQISIRHGNFVVNRGNASATDIWNLTREVKRRVHDRFGVSLEEEALFVGDWSEAPGY